MENHFSSTHFNAIY